MKFTKKLLSCLLALILAVAVSVPAFAEPQYNPYIDRNTIIGSDFSVTWDKVEAADKYDMCLYPLNSGSPTYVNFTAADVSSMGSQYHISGIFLKNAVSERATKDKLTGVTTFALRINEVNSTRGQLIDYSYFKVDLSTMKLLEHSFIEIKEIHLIFNLKDEVHPITTDTPHIKVAGVYDRNNGTPFLNIYKAGSYTLDVRLKSDDGYVIDSAAKITVDGKSVNITGLSIWESLGDIYVEADLQKDEVHGKAPSFWQKLGDAFRNFFYNIGAFFRRIFGFGVK